MTMRILLVDDHKIMRDGLRAILEKHKGMQVVGDAANGREAITLAAELHPHVVVMDVTMPGLNGIDATQRITAAHPGIKVLGLSMSADRRYVLAMLTAGAAGYLLKDAAAGELVLAIETVAAGRKYLSSEIAGGVVDSLLHPPPVPEPPRAGLLSIREREVLQLLAEGKTSKEIGAQLQIAVPTVETHRRQIMDKLSIRSIAELTKYAVREGLTSLDR